MFYDALTLRAYARELVQRFPLPWFVQKFSQISEHDFLLSLRLGPKQNLRFLLGVQPHKPVFQIWRGDKPQALAPSSFTMLCRKYLQGRSVVELTCEYPERILRLQGHEHQLVLELLERQPNLLLLDSASTILGGHRLGRSPERDLRVRRTYTLPPRPDLPDANHLTPYQREEIYLASPPQWPQSLLQRCFGLSPAACQRLSSVHSQLETSWEAMWRQSEPGGYRAKRLPDGRISIWGEVSEGVSPSEHTRRGEVSEGVLGLLDLPREEAEPDLLPGRERERQRLLTHLKKQRQKLEVRLQRLAQDRQKVERAEALQREGELLLTFSSQVARGATQVTLMDWDGVTPVTMALDPSLGVVEQAQKRLRQAAKYRRSLPLIQQREESTRQDLAQLEQRAYEIAQADELSEFSVAPRSSGKVRPAVAGGPRRYQLAGFQILVGKSPRQNDALVQKHSARDDLWFHVKDAPGAHVLLKTAGRSPDQEVVEATAALAAHHSSRSKESQVLVSFTVAQRVKKPVGAAPGLVVYHDELTLWVRPADLVDSAILAGKGASNENQTNL